MLYELMVGRSLKEVKVDSDEVAFLFSDGTAFRAYHMQDCCEDVTIHDVQGDWADLIGRPLTEVLVDESGNWPDDVPDDVPDDDYSGSFTWTYHTFRAGDREVRVRWLGTSNGYYSESVYLAMTHAPIEVTVDGVAYSIDESNKPMLSDLLEEHGRNLERDLLRGKLGPRDNDYQDWVPGR